VKRCSKCQELKDFDQFAKRRDSKDGCRGQCKSCFNQNPRVKERVKEYYKNNRDFLLNRSKKRKNDKIDINSKRRVVKRLFMQCSDGESVCTKCLSIKNKSFFVKDNARHNGLSASCNDCKNIYSKNRKKSDVTFRISTKIRSMISSYLKSKGVVKKKKSEEILGCKYYELKIYLESKFKEEMSWENYGLWHIDHIVPISFAKTEEEIYLLNHYTNLQPLWAKDNLSKGNRFIG